MKKTILALCLSALALPTIASASVLRLYYQSTPFNTATDYVPGSSAPYLNQIFRGYLTFAAENTDFIAISFDPIFNDRITMVYQQNGQYDYSDATILSRYASVGNVALSNFDWIGSIEFTNAIQTKQFSWFESYNQNGDKVSIISDSKGSVLDVYSDQYGDLAYLKSAGQITFTLSVVPPNSSLGSSRSSVTAVPEPETYGMLAAGMMLIGAIKRRK
jgi:hypothetical protein